MQPNSVKELIEFSNNEEKCHQIVKEILEKNLSVRQTEQLVKEKKPKKESKSKQLFENYTNVLSKKFQTNVDINHTKNKLTLSISYEKFKDYIEFLDTLCNIDDLPSRF